MKKIFIIILAFSALIITGCSTQKTSEENFDKLAKCLTKKWAIIYTSQTCWYCQKQKSMFGDSWQYITDIDCTTTPTECWEIRSVPNRLINEEHLNWVQSLENLAKKTGCEIYTAPL